MDSEEKMKPNNVAAAEEALIEEDKLHCERDRYYAWAADELSYNYKIFDDDEEGNYSENQTPISDEKIRTSVARRTKRGPLDVGGESSSPSSSPTTAHKAKCDTHKRSPEKSTTDEDEEDEGHQPKKKGKQKTGAAQVKVKYICEFCGKSFKSGQALGGHKRKHYNESTYPTSTACSKQLCQTESDLPIEQRSIPLGPDHQADIPDCIDVSKLPLDDENPMHDLETMELLRDKVVKGRSDEDEATDELKESLGELGLSDTEEVAAAKWAVLREDLFKHVVTKIEEHWDVISETFPGRQKKDILSSYFNIQSEEERRGNNKQLPALESTSTNHR